MPASKTANASVATLKSLFGPQGLRDWNDRAGENGKERYLSILERDFDLAIRELESDAKSHAHSGEDAMTRVLVSYLKGRFYPARSDPNERGHTDILVENQTLNLKWIAEAKIHSAYPVDARGLRQLLHRYTSGVDDRGALVLYVFNEDTQAMMEHWKSLLLEPEYQLETLRVDGDPHGVRFRFLSVHRHRTGVEYTIRHHMVVLYYKPEDDVRQLSPPVAKAP